MASVTIPGTSSSTISEAFSNQYNLALAQQIANALAAASNAHTLNITTASGGVSPPAPSLPGTNELIITGGGDYTIPAAPAGVSDYVVILDTTAPVTIHGSSNTSVWGGVGTLSLVDPALITIAESAGDAAATITGTGDQMAGNNHNDTIVALGNNQTVQAGAGNNVVYGGGTGGVYLMGSGASEEFANIGGAGTVFAGTGSTTAYGSFGASPGADQVFGGTGNLTVATGGSNDTVYAGSGGTTVYGAFGTPVGNSVIVDGTGPLLVASGMSNDTVYGGSGAATVFGGFDSVVANNGNSVIFSGSNGMLIDAAGSSDTVYAGSGNDTVFFGDGINAGNNVVQGGTGNLLAQFVGGAGSVTIFGGSGTASVYGNAGSNIDFQGTQSGVSMVALGPRGAGNGETLNAGASSTSNYLQALSGSDSVIGGSGNDTIIGGVTDAGTTTMTGGAGTNLFLFQHGAVNGANIITDLTASASNLVGLLNYDSVVGGGSGSAAKAALAGATTSGGNTTITLGDGTRITFDNTTVGQLQQHLYSS